MKSKINLSLLLILLTINLFSQGKMEAKLNFGMAFSSPTEDLDAVAGDGRKLQPHISLEAKLFRLSYGKNTDLGIKFTAEGGMDWANVLSDGALTEVNISMPHIKGRVYPLTYNSTVLDHIGEKGGKGWGLIQVFVVNSLHFDYGKAFAKLEEVPYIDEYNFTPETVSRTMTYTGWGLHPQIFASENKKLVFNVFFDFGKYKWENANGGTSGLKTNSLGFGMQFIF